MLKIERNRARAVFITCLKKHLLLHPENKIDDVNGNRETDSPNSKKTDEIVLDENFEENESDIICSTEEPGPSTLNINDNAETDNLAELAVRYVSYTEKMLILVSSHLLECKDFPNEKLNEYNSLGEEQKKARTCLLKAVK